MTRRPARQEEPGLAPADRELLEAFEGATLPLEAFHHREHVRVGYLYVAGSADFAEAALSFRRALRHFAGVHRAAHLVHETVTWAYLALIQQRAHGRTYADSEAFVAAHPDLLDHRGGALSRYYDITALETSQLARETFVLPGGLE